jgi:hypothetical protein
VPLIDHHDRIFPREECHPSSARLFIGLLVLGEGPQGHEILHHVTVLELVLNGVRVVWAGLLEESLKVVCWWPRLALDTVPGGRDVLHVGVVRFLVIIVIVVGRSCNPLWASLSPFLATLGVLLGTLDGSAEWRCLAIARDCFATTWDRLRPDRLLIDGVLGGDAEQLLNGVANDVVWCPKAW